MVIFDADDAHPNLMLSFRSDSATSAVEEPASGRLPLVFPVLYFLVGQIHGRSRCLCPMHGVLVLTDTKGDMLYMLYIGQTVGWGPPSARQWDRDLPPLCVCVYQGFLRNHQRGVTNVEQGGGHAEQIAVDRSAGQGSRRDIGGSAYLPPCSRSNFAADVQCKVEPVQDGKTSMLVI